MITLPKYHFHSDTFIENLSGCISKTPALEIMIADFEERALILLLGQCLYDEFIQQFEWSEGKNRFVLQESADEKWSWLLNGRAYEYDGHKPFPCGCGCGGGDCDKVKFNGIISEKIITNTKKVEKNYLSYFIYYHWKTINESITSGTGEQMPETANSLSVYNKKKRYRAWNQFVMWVQDLNKFLTHHKEDFPDAVINCSLKAKNIYDL